MMESVRRIRNASWKYDSILKVHITKYVSQSLEKKEILDLLQKDFPMYAWSYRILTRRMTFFEIKFINYKILSGNVALAARKEMQEPGKYLGYRAMTKKIREVYCVDVLSDLVYEIMSNVNPEVLAARGFVGKSKRPPRRVLFVSMVRTKLFSVALKVSIYFCSL